jgi:hypothetical protein
MSHNLDQQVAEQVMSWPELYGFHVRGEYDHVKCEPSDGRINFVYFSPSTSIVDSFHVVERMRGLKYWFDLRDREHAWLCRFVKGTEIFKAEADSVQEAICYAALAAMRGTK